MFARSNRLPNARAVKRLYAKGRRLIKPTIFVFVAPTQAKAPRFAVVCGRKVATLAVDRNRLKRVVRSLVQLRTVENLPRADYLLVLRPAANNHEPELKRDVETVLGEAERLTS